LAIHLLLRFFHNPACQHFHRPHEMNPASAFCISSRILHPFIHSGNRLKKSHSLQGLFASQPVSKSNLQEYLVSDPESAKCPALKFLSVNVFTPAEKIRLKIDHGRQKYIFLISIFYNMSFTDRQSGENISTFRSRNTEEAF